MPKPSISNDSPPPSVERSQPPLKSGNASIPKSLITQLLNVTPPALRLPRFQLLTLLVAEKSEKLLQAMLPLPVASSASRSSRNVPVSPWLLIALQSPAISLMQLPVADWKANMDKDAAWVESAQALNAHAQTARIKLDSFIEYSP